MIIHTAMIRDELDVLQMALEELDGKADYHVISEAAVDFHGRPKPLHLTENRKRFCRWRNRIEIVVSATLPEGPDPWVREHAQRDAMMEPLRRRAAGDDTVLICDLDEIPSAAALKLKPPFPVGLFMRTAHSAADWLYPGEQPGSVIAPWRFIRDSSLSAVRDGRPGYHLIMNGGWHFSWLGGAEGQAPKADVSCHLELPAEEFEILRSGSGYQDGRHAGVQMVAADVDETWPAFIRERRCPATWFRPR